MSPMLRAAWAQAALWDLGVLPKQLQSVSLSTTESQSGPIAWQRAMQMRIMGSTQVDFVLWPVNLSYKGRSIYWIRETISFWLMHLTDPATSLRTSSAWASHPVTLHVHMCMCSWKVSPPRI